MFKAKKYRLYPTGLQSELLDKHIGACRFIYNLALETKQVAWASAKVNLSYFDLSSQLPELKKAAPWLKEVNSQSLQNTLKNLDNAFRKSRNGQGFPSFKKKGRKESFSIIQGISLEDGKIKFPKFKEGVKITLHREAKGEIKRATISKTPTGKYFVSLLLDTYDRIPAKAPVKESSLIGIDLGLNTYAVTSCGKEYSNPRFLRKCMPKLKYIDRKYSKYKGKRTKQKLVRLYEKVTNRRNDFLHKLSSELIRENQSIALETLTVSNMLKNHKLAQSIRDASWSTFVSMLSYKADWHGRNILKIGKFEPSSKTHNSCGFYNKVLSLSDRQWVCGGCGELVNRDLNAAINIKNIALKNHLSVERGFKNLKELPELSGVMTLEADHSSTSELGGSHLDCDFKNEGR